MFVCLFFKIATNDTQTVTNSWTLSHSKLFMNSFTLFFIWSFCSLSEAKDTQNTQENKFCPSGQKVSTVYIQLVNLQLLSETVTNYNFCKNVFRSFVQYKKKKKDFVTESLSQQSFCVRFQLLFCWTKYKLSQRHSEREGWVELRREKLLWGFNGVNGKRKISA